MLKTAHARLLGAQDAADVRLLLDVDPIGDVFVASRVLHCGVDEGRLGAQIWGYGEPGRLASICYSGANLVPVQAGPDALRAFAERARRQGRRCSSIVGEATAALRLWELLAAAWGPAREIRSSQPLLVLEQAPAVAGDPRVRQVRPDEVDLLLPACIAMFTEEVGVSPLAGDGGALYRARVAELVDAGRAFALIEGERVLFKAEIGAATPLSCQVQGVWVDPALRGTGLGTRGTAAVVDLAQARIAPVVSLYVNDFNTAARAAYARVGFTQAGACASVLF